MLLLSSLITRCQPQEKTRESGELKSDWWEFNTDPHSLLQTLVNCLSVSGLRYKGVTGNHSFSLRHFWKKLNKTNTPVTNRNTPFPSFFIYGWIRCYSTTTAYLGYSHIEQKQSNLGIHFQTFLLYHLINIFSFLCWKEFRFSFIFLAKTKKSFYKGV